MGEINGKTLYISPRVYGLKRVAVREDQRDYDACRNVDAGKKLCDVCSSSAGCLKHRVSCGRQVLHNVSLICGPFFSLSPKYDNVFCSVAKLF